MNKDYAQEIKLFQNSVAMTVTLISFGMLFATMFLGYFLVRFSAPVWPPVEIQGMPKLIPFLSTLVIALSSLTYFFFERKYKQSGVIDIQFWLATTLLGFIFLVLQWNLWAELNNRGILISNGMVPSMVYAFSWTHAAHIIGGLFLLLWLGFIIIQRKNEVSLPKVINVGKFWHFLGIVWLIIYLLMFVL